MVSNAIYNVFALQLEKINVEQKSKIRKTERALKIAEVSYYHVKFTSCLMLDDDDSYTWFPFLYVLGRTDKNKIWGHIKGQRVNGGNELMDLFAMPSTSYILTYFSDVIFENASLNHKTNDLSIWFWKSLDLFCATVKL